MVFITRGPMYLVAVAALTLTLTLTHTHATRMPHGQQMVFVTRGPMYLVAVAALPLIFPAQGALSTAPYSLRLRSLPAAASYV